jgi:hypothetical protein
VTNLARDNQEEGAAGRASQRSGSLTADHAAGGADRPLWDETQKIAGKDPDFNRRDLWDAIEAGDFPEWELGVRLIPEPDEFAFDFDLLDATKLVPEERVPPCSPSTRCRRHATSPTWTRS